MFSAPKLSKSKALAAPTNKMNSSGKYILDLTGGADLCNRSFDTAQALYQRTAGRNSGGKKGFNNLRQTRLAIRKCTEIQENPQPGISNKPATKSTEFFLLPIPKNDKNPYKAQMETLKPMSEANDTITANPIAKYGRNVVVLLGKVDFCLKLHKLYANINALWSVFGKLIKIAEGKNRFEYNLLLRNTTGDGPVLKCVFYDFGKEDLRQIQVGDALRVVGHFKNENNFNAYKIEKSNLENSADDFSRIQNVISFVLLQKQTQEVVNN